MHHSIGEVIAELDQQKFWKVLVDFISEYIPVDNWAALIFSDGRPDFLLFSEVAKKTDDPDPLLHDYAAGLYLLDPFYIRNRDNPQSGFYQLSDVAPDHFLKTEYYDLYFTHYIGLDEVQYNVLLDSERTLCLSLGSKKKVSAEHISILNTFRPWVMALMKQRMSFEHEVSKVPLQQARWKENFDSAITRGGTSLTARELDVIRLVLSGSSNKKVAEKLSISIETVKIHRRHSYAKLNVKSQYELFTLFLNSQATAETTKN
nr:helix-turn-helix transcriptional regulator [Pseudomonas sp. Fl4BN1]